ncbi:phospholipase, patatin family protein, partial [Aureobasidium melanogenum]
MLGRLEMSVDECIVAYSNLTETVFSQKLSRIPFDFKGKVKAQFDSAQLGAAINNVVAQCATSDTDLFDDGTSRGCRTFVCSIDHHTKDMVRLRSYDLPHESNIRATICQAALATSAATTFFDSVNIGDRCFADGGFGANNPVDEVEGEAINIWCQETGDLKPLVKCFISIGTGNPGKKAFEDSLLKFLTETVVGIATETEQTDKKFHARWAKHYDDKRYFRFNVEQGLQDVGLEEYTKKGTIEAARMGISHTRTATDFSNVIAEFNERCMMVERHLVAFSLEGVPAIDHFVQRDEDMQKLEGFLLGQTSQPVRRKVIVVHGLGGIGKTQLCIEFVRKHQARYTAVLWMDGSSEDALQQSFVNLFPMLPSEEMPADLVQAVRCQEASTDLIVKGVLDWLSLPSNQRWLQIIDNVDHDVTTIHKDLSVYDWKKYSAHADHGSLLITSRVSTLTAIQSSLQLTEMNDDQALALLKVHCGEQRISEILIHESKDLEGLLRRIEGMPLALAQAGAYIGQTNTSLGKYLDNYDRTWNDLIEAQDFLYPLQEYAQKSQRSMLTTWMISYEQVRNQNCEAATLLKLWAFLDRKDIWYELIACANQLKSMIDIPEWLLILAKTPLKFQGALGLLKKYSLVNNGTDNDSYSMHPVLHSWCRHLASMSSTSEITSELALSLVTQMMPDEGASKEAAEVLERALEQREKIFGERSPSTVASIAYDLANIYIDLKKYAEAQQLAERALAVFEKFLISFPGQSALLTVPIVVGLTCLGRNYDTQSRHEDAEDMYKRAIAVSEQHQQQNSEYGNAIVAMIPLGHIYAWQARLIEAEIMFERALELSSKIYGPDHHLTLATLSGLSGVCYKNGKVFKAKELDERVAMGIDKTMFEDFHPSYGIAERRIHLFERQGKLAEAVGLAEGVVRENEERLGPEHPDSINACFTLAGLYAQDNKLQEAKALCEQLVLRSETSLHLHDWLALKIMEFLASIYTNNFNMLSEAEELFKRVTARREERLGPDHSSTLASVYNLGSLYRVQGDKIREVEMRERVFIACRNTLGTEHERTLEAARLLRQALGRPPAEFSLSSRNIMLFGNCNLFASCERVDGSWLLSSISLNDLLKNQMGQFAWVENKQGNFVATARNIRLQNKGTFLAAELIDEQGVWRDASVHLDERISNHDGKLTFMAWDEGSDSAISSDSAT